VPAAARVLGFFNRGYSDARIAVASTPLRLAVFGILVLGAKWQLLGQSGFFNDSTDAQHFSIYEEAARVAVTKFHELPFWNPYYCGGLPALGTPSARFASPAFLLTLLLGTLRAEPLILAGMTVIGLEGTYRYVRECGGGPLGAALSAPVFALSGCFMHWPLFGWTNFYSFQLIPWALLGARSAFRGSPRGVVVLAVAVSWMIGFGGTYAAPLTAIAIAWEGLLVIGKKWGRPREVVRVLLFACVAASFAALMSLVRLWPIVDTLSSSPRILGGTESSSPGQLWFGLFGEEGPAIFRGGYLIGKTLLPLFLLGAFRKRALPFLASSLLWLWLAQGYGFHGSLFGVLRMVPPFTMLRAPERVLPFFALGFAVVTALFLRWVELMARRKKAMALLALACVGAFGGNIYRLVKNDSEITAFRTQAAPPAEVDRPFRQTRGNRWIGFYYAEMSRGTLACFDDYNIPESADLRGDLPEEEYLRDPEAGTVTRRAWAPNRLDLDVVLSRPARVYINQNWHPGWHTSDGVIVDDDGLLTVDLPAGTHTVVLRFWPRSAVLGGLTSLAAFAVAVYVWRRTRRRPEFGSGRVLAGEIALFAIPVFIPLLGLLVLREPRRPPTPLVTPEGEAIVVSGPPKGAQRVDEHWVDEGITLEAVRFDRSPGPSKGDTWLSVELDWRLAKKPPAGLAVSLQVDGSSKGIIAFDYALFSGALLIDDAPLMKTLRDVSQPLLLTRGSGPRTIRVLVGLSYARLNGRPLTNVHGGAERDDDGRVVVGSFVVP
jgi:hypothetical protein